MKLIYLGQELDAEQEHELFSTNEFGFNVIIEKSYIRDRYGKIVEVVG